MTETTPDTPDTPDTPTLHRGKRREIRRLAMQALYQLDLRSAPPPPGLPKTLGPYKPRPTQAAEAPDLDTLVLALDEDRDPDPEIREAAGELALAAWHAKDQADALASELAPDWPTPRQPPVDRAILRLAMHEIATGRVPAKIAINEAIELAKAFGAEASAAFVNGVLDKAAKRIPPANAEQADAEDTQAAEPPPGPPDPDAWLKDATDSE